MSTGTAAPRQRPAVAPAAIRTEPRRQESPTPPRASRVPPRATSPETARLVVRIPGQPQPWMRAGGNGSRRYNPPQLEAYEEAAAAHAFRATAVYACEHRRQWDRAALYVLTVAGFRADLRRADVDNIAKSIMDGLTKGCVWDDDSQVVDMRVVRALDRTTPRLTALVHVVDAGYAAAEAARIEAAAERCGGESLERRAK